MKLQEALAISAANAAVFGNCNDIVYRGWDKRDLWWIGNGYKERNKPLHKGLLQAECWYPVQPLSKNQKQDERLMKIMLYIVDFKPEFRKLNPEEFRLEHLREDRRTLVEQLTEIKATVDKPGVSAVYQPDYNGKEYYLD